MNSHGWLDMKLWTLWRRENMPYYLHSFSLSALNSIWACSLSSFYLMRSILSMLHKSRRMGDRMLQLGKIYQCLALPLRRGSRSCGVGVALTIDFKLSFYFQRESVRNLPSTSWASGTIQQALHEELMSRQTTQKEEAYEPKNTKDSKPTQSKFKSP